MKVKVVYFSIIRDYAGTKEETIDLPNGSTLSDLLDRLKKLRPNLFKLEPETGILTMVNGKVEKHSKKLKDGDEVALLPPVSGGVKSGVVEHEIEIEKEVEDLIDRSPLECGALVIFIGFVKGKVDGKEVKELEYEAYEPYASKILAKIAEEGMKEEGVGEVRIYHRTGSLKPKDPTVYILVSAVNRERAFHLARNLIERVKRETPIFKLEKREDGDYWIVGYDKRIPRHI